MSAHRSDRDTDRGTPVPAPYCHPGLVPGSRLSRTAVARLLPERGPGQAWTPEQVRGDIGRGRNAAEPAPKTRAGQHWTCSGHDEWGTGGAAAVTPGAGSGRLLPEHIRRCIGRIREYTGGRRATFDGPRSVQDPNGHGPTRLPRGSGIPLTPALSPPGRGRVAARTLGSPSPLPLAGGAGGGRAGRIRLQCGTRTDRLRECSRSGPGKNRRTARPRRQPSPPCPPARR